MWDHQVFWISLVLYTSVFQLTSSHLQASVLVSMQVHDLAFYTIGFCSISKGPIIGVVCVLFSEYMAVKVSEASIQKGIANNFLLVYHAFGAMIIVPGFISLFYHKPSIYTCFEVFISKFFTLFGLVLHQDVLIRSFLLEDLFSSVGKDRAKVSVAWLLIS